MIILTNKPKGLSVIDWITLQELEERVKIGPVDVDTLGRIINLREKAGIKNNKPKK